MSNQKVSNAKKAEEQRNQARAEVLRRIDCRKYLKPAPNHRGNNGYCCIYCGSGTHGTDSTGAVKYYPDTNTWYCHACSRSGDIFDLYRDATGADYNAALYLLAAEIGINLPAGSENKRAVSGNQREKYQAAAQSDARSDAQRQEKEKEDIKHAEKEKTRQAGAQDASGRGNADYTEYYRQCNEQLKDPAAIKYLNSRWITLETAAKYNLGYDPAADPASAPGATGTEYKPHPCPRIIIPCSRSHYVARSINKDTPKQYRLLNPNQEKGGGQVSLFNQQAISSPADIIFVMESAFDALSFLEAGEEAIALNGKGNGRLLTDLLQDQEAAARFIIVPDNDQNPKTAADTMARAEELKNNLCQMGYIAIVYNVAGEYKDANDALKADRDGFIERIQAARTEALQQEPPEKGQPAEENADQLKEFLAKIQTEAYKPYKTELSFFDDLIGGGVIRQTILLLMAPPGTGKTTLCAQIAEQMATHGKPVIYINLEMSAEQMLAKAISSRATRSGEPLTALQVMQGYSWTEKQKQAVIKAVTEYGEKVQPYLSYNPDGIGSDLDEIRDYLTSAGEKAKAAGQEAPVIILDYLHLISSRAGLEAQELVKQAILMLKQYAITYNTFVIGISATNRASNTAGRITLESGRDSSSLEYTADYQISLNYYEIDKGDIKQTDKDYNEKISKLQQEKWRRMIIRVLKGRFCAPGKSARVYFDAENNLFYGENDFMPADNIRTPFNKPAENIVAKI